MSVSNSVSESRLVVDRATQVIALEFKGVDDEDFKRTAWVTAELWATWSDWQRADFLGIEGTEVREFVGGPRLRTLTAADLALIEKVTAELHEPG